MFLRKNSLPVLATAGEPCPLKGTKSDEGLNLSTQPWRLLDKLRKPSFDTLRQRFPKLQRNSSLPQVPTQACIRRNASQQERKASLPTYVARATYYGDAKLETLYPDFEDVIAHGFYDPSSPETEPSPTLHLTLTPTCARF
ncbi:hypothetical protein DSO57_1005054 [Entomophthora muscae]|uniref:Uncharacterized protein n=2 Tax=Entomophthora muscae TaxID=34485 RepID=A0ACC2URD0_9FUNG|nr:hypothetical protein DSO57_1012600 [Entomophthora muscae]KAJ9090174.1 hypothetical protein DSO57_1005054 [Entomophthora muscae]